MDDVSDTMGGGNFLTQGDNVGIIRYINKNCKLTILHQNVQSISTSLNTLKLTLSTVKPDIIALSEVNLNEAQLKFLNVEGYSIRTHFLRKNTTGGGVMLLALNNIRSKTVCIPIVTEISAEKEFECCLAEFNIGGFVFVLGGLYRTPSYYFVNPFLDKLEILIETLCNKYENVILTGDININVLKKDNVYIKFKNILKMYNMFYTIDFPTRVTSTSKSAIDNFITNITSHKMEARGIITKISDHDAQILDIFNISCMYKNKVKKETRIFSQTNMETFFRCIANESWMEVYRASVENKYEIFQSTFKYYFDLCFPKKLKFEKANIEQKWITEELKNLKFELVELEKAFRLTKHQTIKNEIKTKRMLLNTALLATQKKQIKDKIQKSSNKVKTTWSVIKSKTGKEVKSRRNFDLEYDGRVIVEPLKVSETFNSFFINAVEDLIIPKIPPSNPDIATTEASSKFVFKPVNEHDVFKTISSLENKFSTGFDDIPMSLIKQSAIHILKPLAHLVNSSFISGIFPSKLKITKVIPIFKKGELKDISCYRPISLLPAFSKIFEKIVYSQLLKYLETNNLLDKEQHGFRPGKSTITAGVEFLKNIVDSIDNREKVVGIFLDLSRAFDSVSHCILIEKLKSLGVRGKESVWFSSYLNNRQQYVEIEHMEEGKYCNYLKKYTSKPQTVKYGVPQGSILGPLLFLCYLGGLPQKVTMGSVCLYADDTNLIIKGKSCNSIEMSSNLDLKNIKNFLDQNNLLLNAKKSNIIFFSPRQNKIDLNPQIKINNELLLKTNETKFLGLTIDENLSWNKHVENVVSKMASGIYALWQMSKISDLDTLKTLYHALIQSHVHYGISIYGATSKQNLDKILLKQKKAIRIMAGLKISDTVKHLFIHFKILTVYSLYVLESIKYVKEHNNDSLFETSHQYNTRNKVIFDKHNLEFYKNKTNYMGKKFFTFLPNEIKREQNYNTFKQKLKLYLIDKALYSLSEFP